jgi:hypothetical protein
MDLERILDYKICQPRKYNKIHMYITASLLLNYKHMSIFVEWEAAYISNRWKDE